MEIKNFVFDLGNVLVDYSWREFLHGYGYPAEIEERIARALFLSPNWKELDRGVMADEEIYGRCLADIPDLGDYLRPVWEKRGEIVTAYGYAEPLLTALKGAGYGIYVLSNYGRHAFLTLKAQNPFLELADGMVVSYEVGKVKPEPGIYEELLRRFPIRPEESLYLDDLPENIEAGRRFGFPAILFDGLPEALEEMKGYGITLECDGGAFRWSR